MGSAYNISLGLMLNTVYKMSDKQYKNQSIFYARFWGSYHQMRSEKESIDWMTNQSMVSGVLRSMHDMPDEQYQYYTDDEGDDHIRADVQRHLGAVVRTCRQYNTYHDTLLSLVECSNNLEYEDKQYILAYTNVDEDKRLEELMYRMIYILIREPNDLG